MNAGDHPGFRPDDLRGRLAVVTGAGKGIGMAITTSLASAGCRVLALDIDQASLEDASFPPGMVTPVVADVGRRDSGALGRSLVAQHGPVELIVNNVGVTTPHRWLELDEASFDKVMDTNLRGPWFFTKALATALIEAGRGGAIVFISSLHDSFLRLHPHYSASKAAVNMLAAEMAYELAEHHIRVNVVAPGSIRTESNPAPEGQGVGRLIPLGRVGRPDDVARVVAFLLSDAASGYITGARISVDGGLGLHSWMMDE